MADRITREQRSKNMAAVKSRGNKSTEQHLIKLLRANKIAGWRRHYGKLPGKPDFVFVKQKIVVFVDGCFWHKCPRCYKAPKNNKVFWKQKINKNALRDRQINRKLRASGWRVIRLWEHELKNNPQRAIMKLKT